MSLELKQPDDASQDDLSLELIDIQEFHADLEAFIDARVAALRKQFPGLPPQTIRATLAKGSQCLCSIATRMLKEAAQ
jgi:hypothetical protein